MDIPQIYTTAAGGCFVVLMLLKLFSKTVREKMAVLISKYLTYRPLLHRHWLLGPWTRSDVLIQLTYIAINAFCLGFRAFTLSKSGLRAAELSLINMIPLFAGPHLGFLADLFAFRLSTYRRIHRSAGWISFALLLFHVLVVVTQRTSFSLHILQHLYGTIAGSTLCLLMLLSHPLLRKASYEIFLRTHQALAAVSAWASWRHLPSQSLFPRMYIYIAAALFLSTFIIQMASIFWRNGLFRQGRPRALLSHAEGAVKIQIRLAKPVKIRAGQYINLWLPSAAFWSFLQSHPFIVTSWSPEEQNQLDLFVEPRRGLTRELLYRAQANGQSDGLDLGLVLFSGPHGTSVAVGEYESVLMFITGFGITAVLPYLVLLIYGYQNRQFYTRKIRLVWQIEHIETALAMQPLLNDALKGDNVDKILSISIFSANLTATEVSFGRRGTVHRGSADMAKIVQSEMSIAERPQDVEAAQGSIELKSSSQIRMKRERTLVMVSGTTRQRDDLQAVVREHLDEGAELFELEYQP